jgi:hypothetical protein
MDSIIDFKDNRFSSQRDFLIVEKSIDLKHLLIDKKLIIYP